MSAAPSFKVEHAPTRILLIEHDVWDVGLIEEALAELDERQYYNTIRRAYELVHAETLAEAIRFVRDVSFDAVLLNLNLEESQGLSTLFQLRAAAPGPPVIILSDTANEALANHALKEGAQDYLLKSEVEPGMLARCLRYAKERQQLSLALGRVSMRDELTGLYNRGAFVAFAEHAIRVARRVNARVAVLLAGLTESSGGYDQQLARLDAADVLRSAFAEEVLARVDDNRFAVLLVETSGVSGQRLEEILRNTVSEHNSVRSNPIELRIQLTHLDPPHQSVESLLGTS
jgi:DNA-binding NarL/FixJ family response regulator